MMQSSGESNNSAFEISQSFRNRLPWIKFLCPVGLDSLEVQGNINSAESFSYVKLAVKPCQSSADSELICAPKSVIAKQKINIVILKA